MIFQPHPCAAGCGAMVMDDDERTCSLPCTVEVQRQWRARQAQRGTQLMESRLIERPPPDPLQPPPKKRNRKPASASPRKR